MLKALVAALVLVVALFTGGPTRAQSALPVDQVLDTWYRLTLELIRHTPTQTPPVASRALAYLGITGFEALASGSGDLRSLAGQLQGLTPPPLREVGVEYDEAAVLEAALATTVQELFSNTGPTGQRSLRAVTKSLDALTAAGRGPRLYSPWLHSPGLTPPGLTPRGFTPSWLHSPWDCNEAPRRRDCFSATGVRHGLGTRTATSTSTEAAPAASNAAAQARAVAPEVITSSINNTRRPSSAATRMGRTANTPPTASRRSAADLWPRLAVGRVRASASTSTGLSTRRPRAHASTAA